MSEYSIKNRRRKKTFISSFFVHIKPSLICHSLGQASFASLSQALIGVIFSKLCQAWNKLGKRGMAKACTVLDQASIFPQLSNPYMGFAVYF